MGDTDTYIVKYNRGQSEWQSLQFMYEENCMAVQRRKGTINSDWESREDSLEELAWEIHFERLVGFNQ